MDINAIYNTLFLGKTLKIKFETAKEAENFRIRLHSYKTSQELPMLAADMIADEDRTSLSFILKDLEATIRFRPKQRVLKTYTIISIED